MEKDSTYILKEPLLIWFVALLIFPVTGLAQTPSTARPKGQNFNVTMFGAKGDGTTDDTAALNAALRAAKAAHGVLYFPPGTYKYSSPLNFTSILNMTIEGSGPTESIAGVRGADSTLLLYEGSALPSACPAEFTNSSYLIVKDIGFASSSQVACQVLLGSAQEESFHLEFDDVAISRGSVASIADFGGENVAFYGTLGNIVYGPDIGFLISSNGGQGYGIKSNFGYTFTGPWSTSGYSFADTVFSGFAPGHAVEVDGTGRGMDAAFMSFRGVFFQLNAAGNGAAAFYVRGEVDDVTFTSPRIEIDVGSDKAAFIQGAPDSNLVNVNTVGLNTVDGGGGFVYGLQSDAVAQINGMTLDGDAPAVSWVGNISGLQLKSYTNLKIRILGSLKQSSLDSFTGHGNDVVSVSGPMNADINGLKNVIWYLPVFSGSSTYTLPSWGFLSGIYKATYNSAGCEFVYSEGFGAGDGPQAFAEVSSIGATTGFGPAQSLSCPPAGRYRTAPKITATYTNTGGVFTVQRY